MESIMTMTPSQKIKKLRESRKYTQEALAAALNCSKSKISKAEAGELEYSKEDIRVLKKFFEIEDAPFTVEEELVFRQRLYKWNGLIRNGFIEEARRNQESFSVVTIIPCTPALSMLYRMFEVRLVLKGRNPELAEKMMSEFEHDLGDANQEIMLHYFYNKGSVYFFKRDFNNALKYYIKARELEAYALERDIGLYFNIALCYSELGKYALAISTIERNYAALDYSNVSIVFPYINSILALNYMRIGQVALAKQLLEKSLAEAISLENKLFICIAKHYYARACMVAQDYDTALDYFDQFFECHEERDVYYFENMYFKIRCLIAAQKKSIAKPLLHKALPLAERNEFYTLAFESLLHMLSINNDSSIEFIGQKTIPYLVEKYDYYKALDYCELLVAVYEKRSKGYKFKSLEMNAIMLDIMKKMYMGENMANCGCCEVPCLIPCFV